MSVKVGLMCVCTVTSTFFIKVIIIAIYKYILGEGLHVYNGFRYLCFYQHENLNTGRGLRTMVYSEYSSVGIPL